MLNWPKPTTVKDLQRFLGFPTTTARFIRNCSSTTTPLSALTSQKNSTIQWTDTALTAFETFKLLFTSAPILRQPNPTLLFFLEVDAAEVGVGAVLSQRVGPPPKLHPCGLSSKKLSPAERNYDVKNRELLAIKLTIEEWRHWLIKRELITHSLSLPTTAIWST